MRGGNGGSRSFLSEVGLSFGSMIVLRKGEREMCGRKWIRVAIGRRIDGRNGREDLEGFVVLYLPLSLPLVS